MTYEEFAEARNPKGNGLSGGRQVLMTVNFSHVAHCTFARLILYQNVH